MATITKSIGTTGRDYSTIQAWEDDLDSGAIYSSTDEALGECYDDSDFDESVTIDGGSTIGLSLIRLSVASAERHDGSPGTGVEMVPTADREILLNSSVPTTIEYLEIDGGGSYVCLIDPQSSGGAGTTVTVRWCLIHDLDYHNFFAAIDITFINKPAEIHNNLIWAINSTTTGTGRTAGIDFDSANYAKNAYNNTIYDVASDNGSTPDASCIAFNDDSDITLTNNICMGSSAADSALDFEVSSPSNATCSYNMSSDATASGTGSLASQTASNEFVSVTGGSEDLSLKYGANADEAGTTLASPSGVETDIFGIDRTSLDNNITSMGAHQSTLRASIGTTSRNYSTIQAWEDDLDDDTVYSPSANAVGECYDDSDFDEDVTFNGGGTIGLSSVQLTVASGERHDGTANTGVNLIASTGRQWDVRVPDGFDARYTFSWVDFDQNGQAENSVITSSGDPGDVPIFENMLFHDQDGNGGNFNGFIMAQARDVRIQNCVFYNNTRNGSNVYGLRIDGDQPSGGLFNVTLYNIDNPSTTGNCTGIEFASDDVDGECKNVIVTDVTVGGSGTASDYLFTGGTTNIDADYNMSEDDTADDAGGANCITGASASDLYVSVTGGSEDLHLKAGADAIDAGVDLGTTPTGVNISMPIDGYPDGYDRDADPEGIATTWDIGAAEFLSAGGGSPVAILLRRRRSKPHILMAPNIA